MDLKIKTYIEPLDTDEKIKEFNNKRNYSAYYATASNLVYNIRNKTFYDAITIESYRCVLHELCMSYNGLIYNDTEPEYIIRLTFSTTGFYDGYGNFGGNYKSNDLGITGLKLSGLYSEVMGFERMNQLKSYDLDLIEAYGQKLFKEQEEIRTQEVNFRLNTYRDIKRKTGKNQTIKYLNKLFREQRNSRQNH